MQFRHMAYVDKIVIANKPTNAWRPLHYQHIEEHMRRKIVLEKLH